MHGWILGRDASESVPALLDSGADYTEIPEEIARRLLRRSGDVVVVRGLHGKPPKEYPKYFAHLEIEGRRFEIQVIATEGFLVERHGAPDESWALIGRDILNEAVILNGPGRVYEFV